MKKLGVVATLLLLASLASAGTINASGEGWCSNNLGCNNTNTSSIANTFAGSGVSQGLFQDWFAFALPSSPIPGATISIWNDGRNFTADSSAVYNLYAASSFSYGGLATGPSLGSIGVSAADTGSSYYVTITLNGAGVAALNANLGSTFVFGGAGGTNPSLESEIFGYTYGSPVAYLTTTNTPEPGTFVMLGSGLVGLVGMLRRKLKV